MAEFIDHAWMLEQMVKTDHEKVTYWVKFLKDRAPEVRYSGHHLYLLFNNVEKEDPYIGIVVADTTAYNRKVMREPNSLRIRLTGKQHFGNLWLAMKCI